MRTLILFTIAMASTLYGQNSGLPANGIPTPPAGAQLIANMQSASGWTACAQACAGGGTGTATVTQNVASPSLSGAAIEGSIASTRQITGLSIGAAGAGYAVNDVVTLVQSGASGGTATVTAVSSGAVTAVAINAAGTGYAVANGLATTGGTGTGLTLNVTSISAPANALFYHKPGCPTTVPGGCAATGVIHVLEDYYEYLPSSDAGIQAVENDPDLYDGSYEYFNSRQCDSVSGDWRLWNMGTNSWITTGYPCPMLGQTNVWHHIREYSEISRITSLSTYQTFEYDGKIIWFGLGDAFPPKALTGTATLNFEFQLDLNANAGTTAQVIYLDNINAWVW